MDRGDQPILGIHYAFLVTEDEFDEIFGRIKERGLDYCADPHEQQPGEINTGDGGRGVYWTTPTAHFLEILDRRRYGGWPALTLKPASG